jgi:hypothetical protein
VNLQVIAGPADRLIWASPALPGARHDGGAAKEYGIPLCADWTVREVAGHLLPPEKGFRKRDLVS